MIRYLKPSFRYSPYGPQKWQRHFRDRRPSARDRKSLWDSGRQNLLTEDFEGLILRIAFDEPATHGRCEPQARKSARILSGFSGRRLNIL